MKRGYPRFLYSDPKNSTSKGPFITHTIFPKAIFRVDDLGTPPFFKLTLLDIDVCPIKEQEFLCSRVDHWFYHNKEELYKPGKSSDYGKSESTF